MTVIKFNLNEHYKTISSWWKKHKWEALPLSSLSENGFVATEDDVLIAASWLYKTDSDIAILEWYISNPNVEWEKREEALNLIIKSASTFAKENGFFTIFTYCKNKRLMETTSLRNFKKVVPKPPKGSVRG